MIKTIRRFISLNWDIILGACIAFCWILIYCRHSGIGVCPDSVFYMSTANNICTRFSFSDFNNIPLTIFPLGYPVFLSFIQIVFPGPLIHSMPFINGILFATVVIFSAAIFNQLQDSKRIIRFLVVLLIISSPGLLEIYSMVWSETLLILLSLLFLLSLYSYSIKPRLRDLIITSVIAGIAFYVRYAGISLILTGWFILLVNHNSSIKKKIKDCLVLGIIGFLPVTINIIRNKIIAGSFSGHRQAAERSFFENVSDSWEAFLFWFPLPSIPPILIIAIYILLLIVFIAWAIYLKTNKLVVSIEFCLGIFFIVYLGFMLVASSISRFENLNSRLLSPLIIPFIILSSAIALRAFQLKNKKMRFSLIALMFIIYLFTQYHQYKKNAFSWEGIGWAGIPGYTEDQWTKSPLIAYLKSHASAFNGVLFSNANDAVYFLTGKQTKALPHKDIPAEINLFKKEKSFYLIWFFDGLDEDLINLAEVEKYFTIKSSRHFKDGIILCF